MHDRKQPSNIDSMKKLQWFIDQGRNRLSVTYSLWGDGEWLGFDIFRVPADYLKLVVEAVELDDVKEVMNLWDGVVIDEK